MRTSARSSLPTELKAGAARLHYATGPTAAPCHALTRGWPNSAWTTRCSSSATSSSRGDRLAHARGHDGRAPDRRCRGSYWLPCSSCRPTASTTAHSRAGNAPGRAPRLGQSCHDIHAAHLHPKDIRRRHRVHRPAAAAASWHWGGPDWTAAGPTRAALRRVNKRERRRRRPAGRQRRHAGRRCWACARPAATNATPRLLLDGGWVDSSWPTRAAKASAAIRWRWPIAPGIAGRAHVGHGARRGRARH